MDIITKVGLIPLYEEQILIHKPFPKRNAGDDVPFGLCRGTRRYIDKNGLLRDLRDVDVSKIDPQTIEKPKKTMINEAEEELGLLQHNMLRLIDMGPQMYHSARKGDYAIHFFVCEVETPGQLAHADDAKDVRWVSWSELQRMAEEGSFKKAYIPIVEAGIKAMRAV